MYAVVMLRWCMYEMVHVCSSYVALAVEEHNKIGDLKKNKYKPRLRVALNAPYVLGLGQTFFLVKSHPQPVIWEGENK